MPLRPILLAVFASLFACPLAAQDKKTVGTLLSMQAGDVACYLTLRDESGQTFRELAGFDICEEKALIDTRVRLTYMESRVIADECAGNPDCTKTRPVMLVVSARPLPAVETLCIGGAETVVFNCGAGDRIVSVCSSRSASSAAGYLKFRFGKPVGGPPEIALPATEELPPRAASGAVVPFSGGGGVWLRFASPRSAYVVYDGIGNWGARGQEGDRRRRDRARRRADRQREVRRAAHQRALARLVRTHGHHRQRAGFRVSHQRLSGVTCLFHCRAASPS